jgi:hypothetical protein
MKEKNKRETDDEQDSFEYRWPEQWCVLGHGHAPHELFEGSWSNRQMSGDAGIEDVKMILIPGRIDS